MPLKSAIAWKYLALIGLLAPGCARYDAQTSNPASVASTPVVPSASVVRSAPTVDRDKLLRIVMIDARPARAVARYFPMAEVLARASNRQAGDIVATSSLQNAIALVCSGEADLLFESLLNAAHAVVDCGLRPILIAAKDGPLRYHSVIFVKRGSPMRTLSDLAGKKILFESLHSASAYWVPLMLLEANGLTVEPMARVSSPTSVGYEFAGEELNVLGRTVHGLVDAGALSNLNLQEFGNADIDILARSEPMPRMLLLASPRFDAASMELLQTQAAKLHEDPKATSALEHARVTQFDSLHAKDTAVLESVVAKLRGALPQ